MLLNGYQTIIQRDVLAFATNPVLDYPQLLAETGLTATAYWYCYRRPPCYATYFEYPFFFPKVGTISSSSDPEPASELRMLDELLNLRANILLGYYLVVLLVLVYRGANSKNISEA
eukprot:TRINITY_DN7185_c0_g2_i8.p2 TRINITY_DN7185_c0_g2~~TRINITY_DN7185_c0_g2_i8.p2  ORF type:complete len:116 (+),score=8.39 TRINITY_DN7185_c0_g2_i8:1-348(+)